MITEIGGTVGDIESFPFIEAIRQLRWELGVQMCCHSFNTRSFFKSLPRVKDQTTQHSVKSLLEQGGATRYHRLPYRIRN